MTAGEVQRWCIITPEYPPLPGAVGEHSARLARAFVDAGDSVALWIPPGPTPAPLPGVTVHTLPSQFGPDALLALRRALRALDDDVRILVQYSPTAFGMRRHNLPFAFLLYTQRERGYDLYFHQAGDAIDWRGGPRRLAGALLHRLMTWLVVQGARRVYVAVPEWQRHLRRLGVRESDPDRVVTWVPVPSTVPDTADAERVGAIRAALLASPDEVLLGHYGAYDAWEQRMLHALVTRLLDADRRRRMLLMGYGGGALRDAITTARPDLGRRLSATGHLEADEVSAHLAACDLLVQPYPHGASAHRPALLAGLALGRPVVSNRGPDTGALWASRHALHLAPSATPAALAQAVDALLADDALRESLGAQGRALHEELFALERGVARLRSTALAEGADDPAAQGAIAEPEREPDPAAVAEPVAEPVPTGWPRVLMMTSERLDDARRWRPVPAAVHALANALADAGLAVTVASAGGPPGDARYASRRIGGGRLPRWMLPLRALRLAAGPYDVVHCHGGGWLPVRGGRPVLCTLHDDAGTVQRLAARHATLAVATSPRTAARTGAGRVIANGVDTTHLAAGPAATAPRIMFVGTLDGAGRGRWLYDLFIDEILPRRPDAELHLVADAAPPSHPRVRFEAIRGFGDRAASYRADSYRAARLLAAPATHDAPAPAMLEAMACGIPVVATPVPWAVELLDNGRFGVLADDAVFADAMLRLLGDDDDEHARLAAAARSRAESRGWDVVARAYEVAYLEVLACEAKGR